MYGQFKQQTLINDVKIGVNETRLFSGIAQMRLGSYTVALFKLLSFERPLGTNCYAKPLLW